MAALLELRHLRLTLGAFTLGELSLALAPGDYLVLLGPSGCGKTTLLRAIAGLYRVGPQQIYLAGRDVGELPPQQRGVGYVAQTADLFPHLDVARNVAFGLSYVPAPAAEKQARFERIVALLGLDKLLPRASATLSGGESKRASLARSLVVNPRMLLLDEPLSMLDYNARAGMLNVLRTIHAELGTATIHVTHDREEAWALEGRCAVMREGRIEQVGAVGELFRRPTSRFVAEFLGGSNIFAARFVPRGEKWFARLEWAEFELDRQAEGERGYLQIRPDSLVPVAPGEPGAMRGVVRGIADRGIYTEVTVEVASGVLLRVHIVRTSGGGLRIGDGIGLRCAAPPHPISE